MSTQVHALRHVPDLYRREPRNVGVIVSHKGHRGVDMAFRFEGWDGTAYDAKAAPKGVDADIYFGWAEYYVRRVRQDRWSAIEKLQRSRPLNFYLEQMVTLFDNEPVEEVLDRFYPDLVTPVSKKSHRDRTRQKINQVFERLSIKPERNKQVNVTEFGIPTSIEFKYSYRNGRLHLMDRLPLTANTAELNRAAHDLLYRCGVASQNKVTDSFITFADLSRRSEEPEAVLRVVGRASAVINVGNIDQATDHLAGIIGQVA